MIVPFSSVKKTDTQFGGKAQILGLLSQQGFKVPPGIILTSQPTEVELNSIISWWETNEKKPLAVRSSAKGEDSADLSFAGQNSSFLNVSTNNQLKDAIIKCFESIEKSSSQAYGEHFLGNDRDLSMNVVLQIMVQAKYSGVFFSIDPRGNSNSWVLEAIDGLGEDLVSGKRTPEHFSLGNQESWSHKLIKNSQVLDIVNLGERAKKTLNYEVDMEWAIDQNDNLYLLQSRPITTGIKTPQKEIKDISKEELHRLKNIFPPHTIWDGQTFAEWTGYPSPLTFDLWQRSFSPKHAFGNALKKLGYLSFSKKELHSSNSILDKVFGHAYVNLDKLGKLFFGPIPYRICPQPRPHLKFDLSKINFETIIKTPLSIWRMISVGWNLSTKRKSWLNLCQKELISFKSKMDRPIDKNFYSSWTDKGIARRFEKECENFATHSLLWPFILIILTESTLNSLTAILKSVIGDEESSKKLKHWMSIGIQTSTSEMNRYFKKSCAYPETRPFFMSRYGHRGPGELDLSHKRWIEIQDTAFYDIDPEKYHQHKVNLNENINPVLKEIEKLNTFKRSIIKQEWLLLKEMLELREQWKMELLKPYAHIRFLAIEIGKRSNINNDIFWLDIQDCITISLLNNSEMAHSYQSKIDKRKEEKENFSPFSFPSIISLSEIESILSNDNSVKNSNSFKGEALSPGLVEGVVRVIQDIDKVDIGSIDENTILVAESTDPGWTALFTKVKGIVVEKGGVLSHCAIVAREMKIPAVSDIYQCHKKLKDGQHIWVDGNYGRVYTQ